MTVVTARITANTGQPASPARWWPIQSASPVCCIAAASESPPPKRISDVALSLDLQVEEAVARDLLQHVGEEG
jgi:hypothetical protein